MWQSRYIDVPGRSIKWINNIISAQLIPWLALVSALIVYAHALSSGTIVLRHVQLNFVPKFIGVPLKAFMCNSNCSSILGSKPLISASPKMCSSCYLPLCRYMLQGFEEEKKKDWECTQKLLEWKTCIAYLIKSSRLGDYLSPSLVSELHLVSKGMPINRHHVR